MVQSMMRRVENDVNPNMRHGPPPRTLPGGRAACDIGRSEWEARNYADSFGKYTTDWHSPNERRIDGEKVTDMIPGAEWLAGRSKAQGNLAEVNPLIADYHKQYPPALPRGLQRDHLHDRNREHSLFDPATPALPVYVRVSRRRADTAGELEVAKARQARRTEEMMQQRQEAAKGDELMRMRSRAIHEAMERRKLVTANNHLPPHLRPPHPSVPPSNPRAEQLERELMVHENKSKTSSIFVDSYTASEALRRSGNEQAGRLHDNTARRTPSRAGWPVENSYFVKSVTRPSSARGRKKSFAVTV